MTLELIDAAPATSKIPEQTESTNRKTQIRNLFLSCYATLTTVAYQTYSDLLVFDADRIMSLLARRLNKYKGPLDDNGVSFEKWAIRWVAKEARRHQILAEILAEHRNLIHKAINDNLWTSATDLAVTHDDVFAEVTLLIFDRAHSLRRRGRAKLSTRLYGLVRKHCWLGHNSKNKRHRAGVQRHIEQGGEFGGCEVMSDEEIASLKASEGYDPGYGEIGLSTT